MTSAPLLEQAISSYSFADPETRPVRSNENQVYQVRDRGRRFCLRIHQPVSGLKVEFTYDQGYRQLDYIRGELDLLQTLHQQTDLPVQVPVANRSGKTLTLVGGQVPVTVLEWLDGEPLDQVERGDDLALAIGGSLANFHAAIRAIDQKQQLKQGRRFVRLEYGAALLGRADQELLTAYQAGRVTATQLRTMSLTLQEIGRRLRKLDRIPELASLVHADLAPSNLLRTDQGIALIDFSLSGYAHWPMDLASLFDHFRGPTEHAAIVAGYEQVSGCPVDPTWIEDYQALGVLLFVAGHHRQYGDEDWFPSKLDRWCETIFAPLLTQ